MPVPGKRGIPLERGECCTIEVGLGVLDRHFALGGGSVRVRCPIRPRVGQSGILECADQMSQGALPPPDGLGGCAGLAGSVHAFVRGTRVSMSGEIEVRVTM